jgi:Flp pilus assembly pilin Flp
MKNFKKKFNEMVKDESAQGMTEYVLLVMVVVAIVILFKDSIKEAISGKMEQLKGQIGGFDG